MFVDNIYSNFAYLCGTTVQPCRKSHNSLQKQTERVTSLRTIYRRGDREGYVGRQFYHSLLISSSKMQCQPPITTGIALINRKGG